MKFIAAVFSCIMAILLLEGCQPASMEPVNLRPNILLIMVDDMGYGDLSNTGNKYIKTPNLDNMSVNSINFRNFYVSPVCAPTRASLLTGKYHQSVGVRSVCNGFATMDPEAVTLAEILKGQGYRTSIFGKWHLGEYYPSVPNAQGFDEFLGFRDGSIPDYFDAVLEHNGKPEATTGYITDVLTDRALGFMHDEAEEPFFCYLAYNAPHSPLQIEPSKFQRFLDMGLDMRTSRVYGMVENIDENIGRIIKGMDASGTLENTIIIFLSDNGPISGWRVPQEEMRYNSGLRDQKFTAYEGGVRTVCYWMWEGHWEPFDDSLSIAAHIDVVPTLASLLQIDLPDSLEIDGQDLSNVLTEHIPVTPDRIYFEDYDFSAVRTPVPFSGIARKSSWKMVKGSELYNLAEDVGEKNNLAEMYPDILDELKREYENYYEDSYADGHFFPLAIKVGYDEENPVYLKSHHGKASGNVEFTRKGGGTHPFGVHRMWTSNWIEKGDQMSWELDFVQNSKYEIGITAGGNTAKNTCAFNVAVNDEISKVYLPELQDTEEWQYVPLLEIMASDTAIVRLQLEEIASSDSLSINELVITRLN